MGEKDDYDSENSWISTSFVRESIPRPRQATAPVLSNGIITLVWCGADGASADSSFILQRPSCDAISCVALSERPWSPLSGKSTSYRRSDIHIYAGVSVCTAHHVSVQKLPVGHVVQCAEQRKWYFQTCQHSSLTEFQSIVM